MKKMFLGLFLVCSLTLAACSSNTDEGKKESSATSASSSQAVAESTTSEDSFEPNKENLDKVAKGLEEKFNSNGEKMVKVEVQLEVADDTSDKPHSAIEVRVIDDEGRKNMQTIKEAVDSNTATDEQKTALYGIQVNVEESAKELDSEYDIVKFVNPDTNGNNIVLALANKNENIIPLVM